MQDTELDSTEKQTNEISVQVDSHSIYISSLKNRTSCFNITNPSHKHKEASRRYISMNSDIAFPDLKSRCTSTRTKNDIFHKPKLFARAPKSKPPKTSNVSKKSQYSTEQSIKSCKQIVNIPSNIVLFYRNCIKISGSHKPNFSSVSIPKKPSILSPTLNVKSFGKIKIY